MAKKKAPFGEIMLALVGYAISTLHEHLGGIVPLDRLHEMGQRRGIRGVGSLESFVNALSVSPGKTHGLDGYVESHKVTERVQSGPEAVGEAVGIGLRNLAQRHGLIEGVPTFGVGHIELRLDPFKRSGAILAADGKTYEGVYDVDRIVAAVMHAADIFEIDYDHQVTVSVIVIFSRDLPIEVHQKQAEKVRNWSSLYRRLVGIDLAGPESKQPFVNPQALEEFAAVFDRAADGNRLRRTAHIGETTAIGLEGFLSQVALLNPARVSHPLAAWRALRDGNDKRGFEMLADRNVIVELCPWSNFITGGISGPEEMGELIRTLKRYGIRWVIATDNPALQRRNLAEELKWLYDADAISAKEIETMLVSTNTFRFPSR